MTKIAIDTEKPMLITVEDYHVDGYQDDSIASNDEGMGNVQRLSPVFFFRIAGNLSTSVLSAEMEL